VPEPGSTRSSREVQNAVELPQKPPELALFSELPGAAFNTPLSCPPAPPKLAQLNKLNTEKFGSTFTRSLAWKGRLNRRSIVFNQVACAACDGSGSIRGA
jgi:hypothetical protein